MSRTVEVVRHQLRSLADAGAQERDQRFFKEKIQSYGVRNALVSQLARKSFSQLKSEGKGTIYSVCEELWMSGYLEESFIACHWSYALREDYAPDDFPLFERWVRDYVSNWASCDTLCNHTIGAFLDRYPDYLPCLQSWARSHNRWMRRAAAASLIIPAREGRFLDDVVQLADILLMDEDDLVRKGYGWMLKAASQAHPQAIFDYVLTHKAHMPRTALRYAIEKLPRPWKDEAMRR